MGRSEPSEEIQTCRHSLLVNHRQSIISILDGISATHRHSFKAIGQLPGFAKNLARFGELERIGFEIRRVEFALVPA